jgi:isopenicillin N synthase-like dioxygenase
MADIIRTSPEGHQEVRTGLGWRRVLSLSSSEATTTLPIISLSDITHPDIERRRKLGKSICDAATSCGFFYISNHGIPDYTIASIFNETTRFFHDLTLDEKMEFDTEKHEHYYGYYPIKLNPDQPAGASEWGGFGCEAQC